MGLAQPACTFTPALQLHGTALRVPLVRNTLQWSQNRNLTTEQNLADQKSHNLTAILSPTAPQARELAPRPALSQGGGGQLEVPQD